ncbi:3'(2'),5'-bisphosphate nucleotidase [Martelella mediterranea]|uniref:3'(2'),5'-bisphosphate nucleotidase CysQ n=2 Tax=Martelella mediterranea TaxID=293089 RepID=A0A4R3NXT1_9HYPH|nr:3'(2'),5'-bisphosphate nucleotidase [Martelella mediterranea]
MKTDVMMENILLQAALEAGEKIMSVFRTNFDVDYKNDASPVTVADQAGEAIILEHLQEHWPDIPVVAEEAVSAGDVPDISGGRFFLVDPLDGTKEFVNRREDFTVNIALVEAGTPVAGIVYAPAKGVAYRTTEGGAEKLTIIDGKAVQTASIACRVRQGAMTAVASRSFNTPETDAYLKEIGATHIVSVGSSLKFCLLADGTADVYPRMGRTMEWDTAAGDAVLRAAGGMTYDPEGLPFSYGKTGQQHDSDFANPHFIAWGKAEIAAAFSNAI